MPEIYSRNIEALSNSKHYGIERLKNIGVDNSFRIVNGKNGHKCIEYTQGSKSIYINSYYDPVREGEKWLKALDYAGEDLTIIFGFGAGYHLIDMDKVLNKDSKVLIIEPSIECFKCALYINDFTKMFANDNVFLYIADDLSNLKYILYGLIQEGVYPDIKIAEFVPVERVHRQYFNDVRREILEFLNNIVLNLNTIQFFSKMWTESFFRNLVYSIKSPGISKLFNRFYKTPLIIISAGPSLDKNIELLKDAKGKAVLLCVGTALKALLEKGIEPDLVISIDGSYKNYEHFEGIECNAPLIFDPLVNSNIPSNYKGDMIVCEVFSYFTPWFREAIKKEIGILKTGGSVANIAFDMAVKTGADPIIFVGQDLAFTNNKTHSNGTIYGKDRVNNSNLKNSIIVKDIFGNKIPTSRPLYSFKTWFDNEIKLYNETTFIDATEGGAEIEGTKIMTLKDVIDEYCAEYQPIEVIINSVFEGGSDISDETIADFLNELKGIKEDLSYLWKRVKRGIKYAEELTELHKRKRINDKRLVKLLNRLERVDKCIKENEGKEFISLILQPISVNILQTSKKAGKEDSDNGDKGIEKTLLLYNEIKEQTDYVIELIDSSIESIKDCFSLS